MQCRTHGQKYLKGRSQLFDQIGEVLCGSEPATDTFLQLVHKYENERRMLLKASPEQKVAELFPAYMLDTKKSANEKKELDFQEKLIQIQSALDHEMTLF